MTPQRAREMFDLVASRSCDPINVPPPCIPFLFPDDGCLGRAHEMCRLILAAGEQSRKVWCFGDLQVLTRNNPRCRTPTWWFHVAATVAVETSGSTSAKVIDPALFTGPVTVATWKAAMNDPAAVLRRSSAKIYSRNQAGGQIERDDDFSETREVLDDHRARLQTRSIQHGPPPYANCP